MNMPSHLIFKLCSSSILLFFKFRLLFGAPVPFLGGLRPVRARFCSSSQIRYGHLLQISTTDEASPTPSSAKRHHSLASKDRYKLFALAALLLLAVWSIFTGTLTLKSSTDDPTLSTLSFSNPDDFDVLEVVEREKLVKKLWNVYFHGYGGTGNRVRLPRFWDFDDLLVRARFWSSSQIRSSSLGGYSGVFSDCFLRFLGVAKAVLGRTRINFSSSTPNRRW